MTPFRVQWNPVYNRWECHHPATTDNGAPKYFMKKGQLYHYRDYWATKKSKQLGQAVATLYFDLDQKPSLLQLLSQLFVLEGAGPNGLLDTDAPETKPKRKNRAPRKAVVKP